MLRAAALLVVVLAAAPGGVRAPAVAGSWYPGDAKKLAARVDELLGKATVPRLGGRVRALVAPHAGLDYSGPTAAFAYQAVRGESRQRVILLGPAHRSGFSGASIPTFNAFSTPLGEIPVDGLAAAALRGLPGFGAHDEAHQGEHSLEMQLPFLQRALQPGWKLLPVLVGHLGPGDAERIADALRPYADGGTLVVASGDFTHFGASYDYLPFPLDAETPRKLEVLDQALWSRIAALDPAEMLRVREKTGIDACGFEPWLVLANLLPAEVTATKLRYEQSGAAAKSYASSVSYLAGAFAGPRAPADEKGALSGAEMRALHRLASASVVASARKQAAPSAKAILGELTLPPRLAVKGSAFVTLKKKGELRGCIGHLAYADPIWRVVAESASDAALRDSRFAPLAEEELDGLTLEVSVLSPMRPIERCQDFRVGPDGIVLEKGFSSAVFLPEVGPEQGWTAEEELAELAAKAGLPRDAWKAGARCKVFGSELYEAPLVR
jgi:AmmeMemoRadiSam system protein B/AmmeMemoRadiSam system protein A